MLSECLGEKKFGGGERRDKRKLGSGRKRSSEHHPEMSRLGSTLFVTGLPREWWGGYVWKIVDE